MITPGKLYVDGIVEIRQSFRDANGDLANPTTVTLKTWSPCCVETSYVYGTDDEITRSATGKYVAQISPDETGRWRFRWEVTGTGYTPRAIEDSFLIQASPWDPNNTWPGRDYWSWWW